MSIDDLRREIINYVTSEPGSIQGAVLQMVLDVRLAEAQSKAADGLVAATWKLFWATVALGVATAITQIISVWRCP